MRTPATLVRFALLAGSLATGMAAAAEGQRGAAAEPRQTLRHGGIERTYVVRAPETGTSGGDLRPLVMVLHGGGGNATNAEAMTGFTEKARKEGFIVVYPEGTSRGLGLLTWNAGHCCGYAMQKGVDDVGFISALIDRLVKDHHVDPRRVYVTGLSNGGMMTHRLGIELSERIAAIAPVIAALFGDEKRPRSPVAAFMINGMLDKSVPPEGGAPGGRFTEAWDGTPTRPALEQAAFWAKANGCSATADKTETGPGVVWRHRCDGKPPVALYLVKNNGHAWPGGKPGTARGDTPTTALDATGLIWEFFKAHTR
jgi:polyhydroxybutyrate depolymerase